MIWLTVSEAAALLQIGERAVRKSCKRDYEYRYVSGVGRGGQQIQIALESLPTAAQTRYWGEDFDNINDIFSSVSKKQRADAEYKLSVVLAYRAFKNEYPAPDKLKAFLKQFNEENPDKPLSKRQLVYWQRQYEKSGVEGLIDNRGGWSRGRSIVPDDMWRVFLKLWCKESKPSLQSCYEMTITHFNCENPPSISAFRRKLEATPGAVKIRHREGLKAYKDKCQPYIPTDYAGLCSNRQWVADHHIFDVLVINDCGDVFRPWLSGWIDRNSRKVVGFVINQCSPNSDIVLDSFSRACYASGIPDEVLLDNGKDYKVYDLFDKSFAKALCNEMNIKVTNAIPYNAKAKPIERFFGTLEGKYCKHLHSYIGGSPEKRPSHMKKLNEHLKSDAMPFEKFKVFIKNTIDTYNNEPHSGLNGKTPNEVYESSFTFPKRVVSDTSLLKLFLMRTTKPLTVGRNGVKISAIGQYYDDEKLFPYFGKKVYVRYNSDDIRRVYVFTEKDEFICIASCVELSSHGSAVTMEIIRANAKKKKALNKFVRDYLPDVEVPTIEEHVAKKARQAKETENSRVIEYFNPAKNQQLQEIIREEERQKVKEALSAESSTKKRTQREEDEALYNFLVSQQGG